MHTFTSLLASGLLGAAALAQAAAPVASGGTTQIFQQRTTDGRILLTDRPYPNATTERAWQVEREDPGAARERALDVRREAQAVSDRVQRSMDRQQRQLDDEFAARQQFARMDAGRAGIGDVAADEILLGGGGVPGFFGERGRIDGRYGGRFDNRFQGRHGRASDHRFDGRIGSPPRRDPPLPRPRLRGSAGPGSR